MEDKSYISVPTWEKGVWSYTEFKTRDQFRDFVQSLFKEPGKYEFDETALLFNEQARIFRAREFYCEYQKGTLDYNKYWDTHKERCRRGVIFKNGKKTWYLPRDYYMWINFLQIFNKMEGKFDFPQVWDVQYHMALYNLLAELYYKHATILKKRQIASSYYHCAKLINQIWFEEGVVLRMIASDKGKVDNSTSGSWRYLEEYRNFLNKNTAWYRPMTPGGVGKWEQKVETTVGNRTVTSGLKGSLSNGTTDKDPTKPVGGGSKIIFHEEWGIAPKGDKTYIYARQSMRAGMITTGIFIGAGSVGELDKCEPMKEFMYRPEQNGFYGVETNLIDEKGTIGTAGLFIPEQWAMPPYIDRWGNSLVEQALDALNKEFEEMKKNLSAELYQLEISQRPRNIAEAFAHRTVSKFPLALISAQKRRIEDKEYPQEFVELERDGSGKVVVKQTNKLPIMEFPLSKQAEDKTGVVVIYERPMDNPEFHTYYASVDPVRIGKTSSSVSLVSIQIYKNDTEVTRIQNGEATTFLEEGKLVAEWCGRFDDPQKNHERCELLIELYNAWTVVENNVTNFIQHMIEKHKQKYLVPADQMFFNKDLSSSGNVYQKYGWTNNGKTFTEHFLNYAVDFCKEELKHETKTDGTIVKTTYGIERIPSIMLLKEMEAYTDGLNVDRLVSWAALVAFSKMQRANRGYKKIVENLDKKKADKPDYSHVSTPFRHMGNPKTTGGPKIVRNPFKNIR